MDLIITTLEEYEEYDTEIINEMKKDSICKHKIFHGIKKIIDPNMENTNCVKCNGFRSDCDGYRPISDYLFNEEWKKAVVPHYISYFQYKNKWWRRIWN